MANQTASHENQELRFQRRCEQRQTRLSRTPFETHTHMYGLLCFRRCSNMNKKPINASKISENPKHTNSYQRIKYEGNSFVEESL